MDIQGDYCCNCSHGEVFGLSVRCKRIHEIMMVVVCKGKFNTPLLDHEIEYMLTPLNFKCQEFAAKEKEM